MPRPDRNPWTPAQLAQLREMRGRDGCSFGEIADAVNRTANSCQSKAVQLGIQLPARMRRTPEHVLADYRKPAPAQTKKGTRPCLCCRQPFPSQGPHNRLCPGCRRGNDDTVFTVPAVVMR